MGQHLHGQKCKCWSCNRLRERGGSGEATPLAEMAELAAIGEPEGAIGRGDDAFESAEGQGTSPVVEEGV